MADDQGLRITVLGSSGTYSSGDSSCSGYLVRSRGATVLLDTGPGSSIELQRHVDLRDLDAIVVSHEHPDHWTELPCLYHGFRYGIRRSGVPTYGTAGTRRLLELVLPDSLTTAFDWHIIDASSGLTIGDQSWTFSRTDHPVETLAPRVEADGRSLAYSADTGPAWSPTEFSDPVDLMVYEATLPVSMEPDGIPHVSGRQAGERARAAGVGRLVVTHVPPEHDPADRVQAAAAAFGAPVDWAEPGRTFVA